MTVRLKKRILSATFIILTALFSPAQADDLEDLKELLASPRVQETQDPSIREVIDQVTHWVHAPVLISEYRHVSENALDIKILVENLLLLEPQVNHPVVRQLLEQERRVFTRFLWLNKILNTQLDKKAPGFPLIKTYVLTKELIAKHPCPKIADTAVHFESNDRVHFSEEVLSAARSALSLKKFVERNGDPRASNFYQNLSGHLSRTQVFLQRETDFLTGAIQAAVDIHQFSDINATADRATPAWLLSQGEKASPYRTDREKVTLPYRTGYLMQLEKSVAIRMTLQGFRASKLKKIGMTLRGILTGKVASDEPLGAHERLGVVAFSYTNLFHFSYGLATLALVNLSITAIPLLIVSWMEWLASGRHLRFKALDINRKALREKTLLALSSGEPPSTEQIALVNALKEREMDPQLKALTSRSVQSLKCQRQLAPAPAAKPKPVLKASE